MLHAIAGSMDNSMDNTVVVWRWPEGTAQYVVSRASSSINSVSLSSNYVLRYRTLATFVRAKLLNFTQPYE